MSGTGRPDIVRRRTRTVRVGDVAIGCDAPIVVQSMTNTDTADVAATVAQVKALADAGSELVRVRSIPVPHRAITCRSAHADSLIVQNNNGRLVRPLLFLARVPLAINEARCAGHV